MHPDVAKVISVKDGETEIARRYILNLKCPLCGAEREWPIVAAGQKSRELPEEIPAKWMPRCKRCGKQMKTRSEVNAS